MEGEPYFVIIRNMKYNPWRSNQSYTFYLVTVIYTVILIVMFSLNLLSQTPALWAYFVVSTIGEIYFIVTSFKEYIAYWKGNKLTITEEEITFFDEDKKKTKTIKTEDLLEFHYKKKGNINFVYKSHGRRDFSFMAHSFSKKECELFEKIISSISKRDAKVDLFNE